MICVDVRQSDMQQNVKKALIKAEFNLVPESDLMALSVLSFFGGRESLAITVPLLLKCKELNGQVVKHL